MVGVPHMQTVTPVAPARQWGPDTGTTAALVVAVAAVWSVMKVLSVWVWVTIPNAYGDTTYYFTSAQEAAAGAGVRGVLEEYPTPAALLLLLPYHLGATDQDAYRGAILLMTSLADAAFAVVLGRRTGPVGVLAWVVLTTVSGHVSLLRFDMVPAVVAGAAVLAVGQGRTVAASVLVGLGTGLKLWPGVLAPLALGRAASRARASLAFVATGVVLVAVSLATGGWARLFTPLGYQGDRGLQVEAVAATLPMSAWPANPDYHVFYSVFHAFEIVGPGVPGWLRAAEVASVFAALACVVLLVRWFRHGARPDAAGYVALVCVGAFIVTSRALSPQYLLWIAAPTAAIIGLAFRPGPGRPALVPATVTFVQVAVLCLLTTGIYPVYYSGIISRMDTTAPAVGLLVARNVGVVAFVAWAAVWAVVGSRRARPA